MTRSNSACAFAPAKRLRTCRGLAATATWLAVALSSSVPVQAEDKEPIAVLELGGASEWGLGAARPSYGPSVAAEFTAIKDWLEIEPGIGPLFNDGHPEWTASVIFRKPLDLSKTIEFEPGIGPEWSSDGKVAGSPEHKFGGFIEQTYRLLGQQRTRNRRLGSRSACSFPFDEGSNRVGCASN
jgi:hypothetical protein